MRTRGGDHEEVFLEEESGGRSQSEEPGSRQGSIPWAEQGWWGRTTGLGLQTGLQEAARVQPWDS